MMKNLTPQYSRSEVMLTFFERSPLDQVLRNDKVHRIQPCFQSPIKISGAYLAFLSNTNMAPLLTSLTSWQPDSWSNAALCTFLEIMRSNGFCLANTETIVFDHSLPEEKERPSSTDSVEHTWALRPLLSVPVSVTSLCHTGFFIDCSASKSPACFPQTLSLSCALECTEIVLKPLNVNQPQDPPTPHRKCVCAPLPSLGVFRKQKRNTFLLVFHTKQDFSSLLSSWNVSLQCSDLVLANKVSMGWCRQ